MQFIDLHTQQNRIKDKIQANIQKILTHGQYIKAPEVNEGMSSGRIKLDWSIYW